MENYLESIEVTLLGFLGIDTNSSQGPPTPPCTPPGSP